MNINLSKHYIFNDCKDIKSEIGHFDSSSSVGYES